MNNDFLKRLGKSKTFKSPITSQVPSGVRTFKSPIDSRVPEKIKVYKSSIISQTLVKIKSLSFPVIPQTPRKVRTYSGYIQTRDVPVVYEDVTPSVGDTYDSAIYDQTYYG